MATHCSHSATHHEKKHFTLCECWQAANGPFIHVQPIMGRGITNHVKIGKLRIGHEYNQHYRSSQRSNAAPVPRGMRRIKKLGETISGDFSFESAKIFGDRTVPSELWAANFPSSRTFKKDDLFLASVDPP